MKKQRICENCVNNGPTQAKVWFEYKCKECHVIRFKMTYEEFKQEIIELRDVV